MNSSKTSQIALASLILVLLQTPSVFASTGNSSSMMLGLTTEQGIWVLGIAVVIFFLFDQVLTIVLKAYSGRKDRRSRTVSLAVKTQKPSKLKSATGK